MYDPSMRQGAIATPLPFGVRRLVSPPETSREAPAITYNEALQMSVSADGNPWYTLTSETPETQTETSQGDGESGGSDTGTDLW